jgi:thioredoxin reductase (NADPH)
VEKVIIVGAGPCGLSTAIELKKRGIDPLIIEKGNIVNTIYHFPTHMTFFSTAELLEIGEVPFIVHTDKPTRLDALKYYREVSRRYQLRIHTYEKVEEIHKEPTGFKLFTRTRAGEDRSYETPYLVIATGYYDQPNLLGIPGEELDKVSHYFKEGHPYHGQKVAVIGGKNSAVDAAMELEKAGADVTVIYRGSDYSGSIKPWIRPLFESLINKGRIKMLWESQVEEIRQKEILVRQGEKRFTLENDFVFAMTGYRPNRRMLEAMGVQFNDESGEPLFDPDTMETNIPGLYISGVIAAGNNANIIFIENGRFHGGLIAQSIIAKG